MRIAVKIYVVFRKVCSDSVDSIAALPVIPYRIVVVVFEDSHLICCFHSGKSVQTWLTQHLNIKLLHFSFSSDHGATWHLHVTYLTLPIIIVTRSKKKEKKPVEHIQESNDERYQIQINEQIGQEFCHSRVSLPCHRIQNIWRVILLQSYLLCFLETIGYPSPL